MAIAARTLPQIEPLLEPRRIPVLPALEPVLGPGLRRGTTVCVDTPSLALALLAAPTQEGGWGAVVGLPRLSPAAAAEYGVALSRLAIVPEPGERWPEVVAALLDGLDIVALRPPRGVPMSTVRRLSARLRQRGSVLVVVGQWDATDLRLCVDNPLWEGLGRGWGRLRGRRVDVIASGRGAAARPRRAKVWLPAPDGGVA